MQKSGDIGTHSSYRTQFIWHFDEMFLTASWKKKREISANPNEVKTKNSVTGTQLL